MDFEKTISSVIKDFEDKNVHYALMGGFAMGVLGIMRTTTDLDFLISLQDMPKVEKIMQTYGYRCIYKTDNVSQYVSDIAIFGEVDILHALRKVSLAMLKRAKEFSVFGGKFTIRVLNPEDIIGLKLQALVNDQSRQTQEYADIEAIMGRFKQNLDWVLISEYFFLFKKREKYEELRKRFGDAD